MTGMPGWSPATTATLRVLEFSQSSRSQIVTPATDHKRISSEEQQIMQLCVIYEYFRIYGGLFMEGLNIQYT